MSTPPSIGIDLIEIERVERAIERRPALAERVFSPGELEYARRHPRPGRHLAARFAAKEAALKALGLGGLRLHEIEVAGGGSVPPPACPAPCWRSRCCSASSRCADWRS